MPKPNVIGRVIVLAAAVACGVAPAQYKIVNPDGSVTYTDRIPAPASNQRVMQLGRGGAAATTLTEVALPAELRQAVQRHPVTLYTSTDCAPCDSGRTLLQQRGVPYTEKRVASDEDAQALERIVGGRTVPSLTVGAQPLRGFSESDWAAYLEAAGYPRQSRLPRGWQPAPITPLAERAAPPARPPAPPPEREPEAPPPPPAEGVRF
jgi:glutaredoxin